MTLGPNLVLRLPTSGSLVKITTINSGNTFGVRLWTDGKREAPMLPDRPWLRRHPATSELFWTDLCEQVASEEWFDEQSSAYREVPFAAEPSLADYELALREGIAATTEQERYLRIRFWWAANDPVRRGESCALADAPHRANLAALRSLLKTDDLNQRMMAIEVARQMGDFAEAARLLCFDFPADYASTVALLTELVEQQDSALKEVLPNGPRQRS